MPSARFLPSLLWKTVCWCLFWLPQGQGGEASRLMANPMCLWLICGHWEGTRGNWELLGFSLRHFSLFGFLLAGQRSSSGWV